MNQNRTGPRMRTSLLLLLLPSAVCVFLAARSGLEGESREAVRARVRVEAAERKDVPPAAGAERAVPPPPFSGERPTAPGPASPPDELLAALSRVDAWILAGDAGSLREEARGSGDVRARIAALRGFALLEGSGARPILLEFARDEGLAVKLRAQAARFLGMTGEAATAPLEEILHADLPMAVRAGALQGVAAVGTAGAADLLLRLSEGDACPVREAARAALGEMNGPLAAGLLAEAVVDPGRSAEARAALCRALGAMRAPGAVRPLAEIVGDAGAPESVRRAAADALGRLGHRDALAAVAAACDDPSAGVAQAATLARSRLEHLR